MASEDIKETESDLRLTEEQIEDYKKTFTKFDKNGDGTISTEELGTVLKELGFNHSEEKVQEIIKEVDADGTGSMSQEEFLKLMSKQNTESITDDQYMEVFKMFDKNGDGFIEAAELKSVMEQLGEEATDEDVAELIREADTDENGRIDYEEFMRVMKIE